MHSNVSVFVWMIKSQCVRGGWVIISVCKRQRTTNETLTVLGLGFLGGMKSWS